MEEFVAFCKKYKWRILGVLGGMLFCILVFTINFWRTLLLSAVVFVGYLIGTQLDEGGRLSDFFDRLFGRK
jgi:uncharacterized membrane protein